MAKRVSGLFDQTEPTATEPEQPQVPAAPADRIVSVGVGLRLSEIALLDQAAAARGIARNALLREIVRKALQGLV
jgi:hypothetical protein